VPEVCLEHYSSREVGARLADAVAAAADAAAATSGGGGGGSASGDALPRLGAARATACALPGGWAFAVAARGACMAAPSLVAPPGGISLISCCGGGASGAAAAAVATAGPAEGVDGAGDGVGSGAPPGGSVSQTGGGVMSIVIDGNGEICQAAWLGPRAGSPVSTSALAALVGLPISYVAEGMGLQQQAKAFATAAQGSGGGGGGAAVLGRQPVEVGADLAARLAQPWAELLLHDGFAALREVLLARGRGGGAAAGDGDGAGVGAGVGTEAVAAAVVEVVGGAPAGEMAGLRRRLDEGRRALAPAVRG
jgi:hypothetical protein